MLHLFSPLLLLLLLLLLLVRWPEFVLPIRQLCSGDWDRTLKFTVYDWNRCGAHDQSPDGAVRPNLIVSSSSFLSGLAIMISLALRPLHCVKFAQRGEFSHLSLLHYLSRIPSPLHPSPPHSLTPSPLTGEVRSTLWISSIRKRRRNENTPILAPSPSSLSSQLTPSHPHTLACSPSHTHTHACILKPMHDYPHTLTPSHALPHTLTRPLSPRHRATPIHSFVDYIKGGCQINLLVAIDFTVRACTYAWC